MTNVTKLCADGASPLRRQVELLVSGCRVKRYHTLDTLCGQNNAEHSFGVASLVYLFYGACVPRAELVLAALRHDLPEYATGDIPAPAKRELGISAQFDAYECAVLSKHCSDMPQLSEYEMRVLKAADTADLLLFCQREISMGNGGMVKVFERGVGYLRELGYVNDQVREFINFMEEEVLHGSE